ncbi:TetR/AcrR family transcriptional regulator [Novosphingobium sp. AP12]|uniref:TetR/AcrR family transcriptional regulator n=1 Tax=Novosphingobium sp. AP12 TaxID=1144305 RepID=UPI000271E22E|nr:TetR/AcrR family transcriptional regulator [Novosphingobium sp. AP12]EJL31606.1 transcriptional regulator [Novosphingobium sp. AP12]
MENKVERRMGPVGSENWHAMLDGAEDILREEGHAALTSRRVAERIGVKQRLIYYYFRTMDDLVVEMFHRLSERALARLREAAGSPLPLREIWDICIHTTDARLVSEFMALAHRIEGLRKEVMHFIEESRAMQVEALEAAMARSGWAGPVPARSLALIATSLGLSLPREEKVGVTTGHAETLDVIAAMFERLEPGA